MKTCGVVSYNIYCNFTNYGSALQSWALCQAIEAQGVHAKLVDYCPEVLKGADPLNPFPRMWDQDAQSRARCEASLPAIRENYAKFQRFYNERFEKTCAAYTAENFNQVVADEGLDGFVCGSDTIFCIDEFNGFDDGYYANYPVMRQGRTVAYAASFGDAHFDETTFPILNERLQNFKAIGLREARFLPYVREQVSVPVAQVVDPTLLLTAGAYDVLSTPPPIGEPYLLLYSRRYNAEMFAYAERLAAARGLKIVDISLQADLAGRHIMAYQAGVEEFLGLVKHAACVVTNSFHGLIFAVQYARPVAVFSREQADSKIEEVLGLFGLGGHLFTRAPEGPLPEIDYAAVHARIAQARQAALGFLKRELELI